MGPSDWFSKQQGVRAKMLSVRLQTAPLDYYNRVVISIAQREYSE